MLNVQCVWLPSPPVLTQKVSTVLSPQREGYHSKANLTLCRWELTVTESVVYFLPIGSQFSALHQFQQFQDHDPN